MKGLGRTGRGVLVLACWLVAGWSARAQELVEGPVPREYDTGSVGDWVTPEEQQSSPFHVDRLHDTYSDALQVGAIAVVAEDLITAFSELEWTTNRVEHARILAHLEVFVGDLRFAMQTPGIVGPLDPLSEPTLGTA